MSKSNKTKRKKSKKNKNKHSNDIGDNNEAYHKKAETWQKLQYRKKKAVRTQTDAI